MYRDLLDAATLVGLGQLALFKGRNDAETVLASNGINHCLKKHIRQFFYRHDTALKAHAPRKTTVVAASPVN
jgi:hypothetical protein